MTPGGARTQSHTGAVAGDVYQSDPAAAADEQFVAGELALIAVGNRGRLLDARRTPVTVVGVDVACAMFEVRVDAFEDAGACWKLPLEDVARFQFARDAVAVGAGDVAHYMAGVARLDRAAPVACTSRARRETLARLDAALGEARGWLTSDAPPGAVRPGAPRHGAVQPGATRPAATPPGAARPREGQLGSAMVDAAIGAREGIPALYGLLARYLTPRGLEEIDRVFCETFVSNPRSGEVVKGHAIVLAELGLVPYGGQMVRNPALFDGAWSRARRGEHLIARLAFTRALWERLGREHVTLYRALASERPLDARPDESFISATFSGEVAAAHFQGGPTTRVAAMWRQVVPVGRLLMTFLETEAMNARFREAEAVVLGEPGNEAF